MDWYKWLGLDVGGDDTIGLDDAASISNMQVGMGLLNLAGSMMQSKQEREMAQLQIDINREEAQMRFDEDQANLAKSSQDVLAKLGQESRQLGMATQKAEAEAAVMAADAGMSFESISDVTRSGQMAKNIIARNHNTQKQQLLDAKYALMATRSREELQFALQNISNMRKPGTVLSFIPKAYNEILSGLNTYMTLTKSSEF